MVLKPLSVSACLLCCAILIAPSSAQTFHPLAMDARNPAQGTISVDLLRYPLPSKALQMLQDAKHFANPANPPRATQRLDAALAKSPASAAWTQSLLGVEYLKAYRLPAAVA